MKKALLTFGLVVAGVVFAQAVVMPMLPKKKVAGAPKA